MSAILLFLEINDLDGCGYRPWWVIQDTDNDEELECFSSLREACDKWSCYNQVNDDLLSLAIEIIDEWENGMEEEEYDDYIGDIVMMRTEIMEMATW